MRNRKGSSDGIVSLIILLIFIFVVFPLVSCRGAFVNKDIAVRALEKQGYSNIEIINHQYFLVGWKGCDDKDAAKFTARAINPTGNKVEVFVCTGWFLKGATIRTN